MWNREYPVFRFPVPPIAKIDIPLERRKLKKHVASVIAAAIAISACSSSKEPRPPCRGDESLVDGTCVPWQEAPLWADFEVHITGRQIHCNVLNDGFPRAWVEAIRFSFGDGFSGYGERISHTYTSDGIYPVDLEVRLRGYRLLRASRPVVIGEAPSRIGLTINRIPAQLNGSTPYRSDNGTPDDMSDDRMETFHLLTASSGFSIDLELLDSPANRFDDGSLEVTTDRTGDVNLASKFTTSGETQLRVRRYRWTVSNTEAFENGALIARASATDVNGDTHSSTLSFGVSALTPQTDPFDSSLTWLLRFDQDLFATTGDGTGALVTTLGPNGQGDFVEELHAIGAQGRETVAGVDSIRGRAGRTGANAVYARWVAEEVRAEIYRYYFMTPEGIPRDGIEFLIAIEGDPGAPLPGDFSPTGSFSMMRFGGTLGANFGRSSISAHARSRIDNTSATLGVATASLLSTAATTPFVSDVLLPIFPGIGVPVGEHSSDPIVLAASFDRFDPANDPDDNLRYDDLSKIARRLGQAIGPVAAHEMGHAMGLVPNGAPPCGFFGNRGDVAFINAKRTDSHHADYPGLNLMQAGGDILGLLNESLETIETPPDSSLVDIIVMLSNENRFSPLAHAYLQRAITYSGSDECGR